MEEIEYKNMNFQKINRYKVICDLGTEDYALDRITELLLNHMTTQEEPSGLMIRKNGGLIRHIQRSFGSNSDIINITPELGTEPCSRYVIEGNRKKISNLYQYLTELFKQKSQS